MLMTGDKKEYNMGRQFVAFIDGYSKALALFPDYNTNNQANDWKAIGMDIQNSIQDYYHTNNMEELCQTKKTPNKHNKSKQ